MMVPLSFSYDFIFGIIIHEVSKNVFINVITAVNIYYQDILSGTNIQKISIKNKPINKYLSMNFSKQITLKL